jgi:lysophospholipase L1-like esterase
MASRKLFPALYSLFATPYSLFGYSLFAAALLAGSATAPHAAGSCLVPFDLARIDRPLNRTARLLAAGDPLTIVALGSSSTAGAGASSPAAAYPARLAVELEQRFPGRSINVANRGVGGELITDMLARLDGSVVAERPDLVLWQVGTNAVLHGDSPVPTTALLVRGLQELKATGADIVIIDPQFAPKVIVNPAAELIVDLIAIAARHAKVGVFRRFAVMRHWHEVEGLPFEAFLSPDGLHMNDWSYACLAKTLATAITHAVARSTAPQ